MNGRRFAALFNARDTVIRRLACPIIVVRVFVVVVIMHRRIVCKPSRGLYVGYCQSKPPRKNTTADRRIRISRNYTRCTP